MTINHRLVMLRPEGFVFVPAFFTRKRLRRIKRPSTVESQKVIVSPLCNHASNISLSFANVLCGAGLRYEVIVRVRACYWDASPRLSRCRTYSVHCTLVSVEKARLGKRAWGHFGRFAHSPFLGVTSTTIATVPWFLSQSCLVYGPLPPPRNLPVTHTTAEVRYSC